MSHPSNPNQLNSISPSLKELLSSDVSSEDRTKGLFSLILRQTKTTDPQLADIMLECAIPRRLDAKTIGILRDAPEDTETNDHLFSRLKLFSFVQLRTDGYYVYHDNTRDVILKVWESDDYREKFNQIKDRLAHFYKLQYQEHRSRGELDESIEDMHSIIEVQPNDGVNYFLRGALYYELQDYALALTDFSKAVELRPADGNNYAWRGIVNYELKDYPAALMDFSKAVELQPGEGLNYYWRGRLIHRESKNYASALMDFSKAVELRPEDPSIYAWRGRVHYELKDYPAALMDFSKAVELRPEDGISYYWRGVIYYGMEDYQAASSDFREAIAYLSQVINKYPEVDGNYYWRARTYYELKKYSAALADLNTSIELAGTTAFDYYWRGRVYYELKDYPAAIVDFSRAIELMPQENLISFFEEIVPHYHFEVYTDAILEFKNMFNRKQKPK